MLPFGDIWLELMRVVFKLSCVIYQLCLLSGTGNGNLIPFLLTNDTQHVPPVLKGIAGIRWYRKHSRNKAWSSLTYSLIGEKESREKIEEINSNISLLLDTKSDYFLCDPPYSSDIEPAGNPIPVVEPVSSSPDYPVVIKPPEEQLSLVPKPEGKLTTRLKAFKRLVLNRIFRQDVNQENEGSCSCEGMAAGQWKSASCDSACPKNADIEMKMVSTSTGKTPKSNVQNDPSVGMKDSQCECGHLSEQSVNPTFNSRKDNIGAKQELCVFPSSEEQLVQIGRSERTIYKHSNKDNHSKTDISLRESGHAFKGNKTSELESAVNSEIHLGKTNQCFEEENRTEKSSNTLLKQSEQEKINCDKKWAEEGRPQEAEGLAEGLQVKYEEMAEKCDDHLKSSNC